MGASTDFSLPVGPPCVASSSCRNKNLGAVERQLGLLVSPGLAGQRAPRRPSPQQGPAGHHQPVAVVELPAREVQPPSAAAATSAQRHQLVGLLGVAPGTWDLCGEGGREDRPEAGAQGPSRGGRGRATLPRSRMTAATVPLQARYGELASTRRSKPALTTAAQRCSWVTMFSAREGRGRGGFTGHALLCWGRGRHWGLTYLCSEEREEAGWGSLGALEERQRVGCRGCWGLPSHPPSFRNPRGPTSERCVSGVEEGGSGYPPEAKSPSAAPSSPWAQCGWASKDVRAGVCSRLHPQLPAGWVLVPG